LYEYLVGKHKLKLVSKSASCRLLLKLSSGVQLSNLHAARCVSGSRGFCVRCDFICESKLSMTEFEKYLLTLRMMARAVKSDGRIKESLLVSFGQPYLVKIHHELLTRIQS